VIKSLNLILFKDKGLYFIKMDIDPNDLLTTNVYINEPVLEDVVNDEVNEEFKKFYLSEQEKKKEKEVQSKLNVRNLLSDSTSNVTDNINEQTDGSNILNTNVFTKIDTNKVKGISKINRVKKDIKSLISIDSRDRNKVLYPLPSNFKIFLGKTFYNVREVRLVSIEFPNTNAVINTNNNLIYWINKEDIDLDIIDNVTRTYPVYKSIVRTGSYVTNSLQSEMTAELGLIKRSNPSKPYFHYFVITLDMDTDVVTFISLILSQLQVNPLTTIVNTGVITVSASNHGYSTGDNIYLLGATTLASIPSNTLTGFHKIIVINPNIFQFEVNINASESLTGGGNVVKTGIAAPFQFLFGEYPNTIAPNIGYPLENSSTLINTYIRSISNFYQLEIKTSGTHFTHSFDYINQNIILNNTGAYLDNNGSPGNSINGVSVISEISNSTTFLISVSASIYENIYVTQTDNNSGSGELVNGASFIAGFVVSQTGTTIVLPLVLTQSNKYYNGWWIKIISGDGSGNVRSITNYNSSSNSIVLSSPLTSDLSAGDTFYLYSAPTFTFNSNVYPISSIVNYNVNTILFTFFTPHNYTFSDIGKSITFYNTTTNPDFDGSHAITGIHSPTSLSISGHVLLGGVTSTLTPGEIGYMPAYNILTTKTLTIANVTPGNPTTLITTSTDHDLVVGDKVNLQGLIVTPHLSGIYTVYTIPSSTTFTIEFISTLVDTISIANSYIGTDLITLSFPGHGFNTIILVEMGVILNTVIIHTQLPHNLTNGQLIRIMNTGIVYIDDNAFTITYLTNDSFSITVVLPPGYIATSTTGILGMSNTFRLYNCPPIGGITPSFLNNIQLNINEIIDENTFNFHLYNTYASSTVTGGESIYISSFLHGFNGTQKNTKNNILNRSINLEGENYAFLCCPQLSTMLNTGNVKNIFARIILDQSPGTVVFNFLSNPKTFEIVPLDSLDTLDISIVNYDSSYYIFNDLDFSFTLEITEVVDTTDSFNISSKRGITDITKQY